MSEKDLEDVLYLANVNCHKLINELSDKSDDYRYSIILEGTVFANAGRKKMKKKGMFT